jgi:hypothetical protein
MFDGEARRESEREFGVGLAKSGFDGRGLCSTSEQKAEVTRSFRPSGNVVVEARGNFQAGDAGNLARGFFSIDPFEDSAARHGNHHDTRGGFFARSIAAGHLQSMTQQEFLESDSSALAGHLKPQRMRAEAADGTGSDFEAPYCVIIQAKFRVQRAVSQAKGSDSAE